VSQENSQPICAMPTLNKLQCPLVHAYIGTKEINDANKGKYQGRGSKPKEILTGMKEGRKIRDIKGKLSCPLCYWQFF